MSEKERVPGPMVTLDDINQEIVSEFYFTAGEGVLGASNMGTRPAGIAASLNLLTFCVLVLRGGFTVTGESACVSAGNFNAQYGRDLAREKAIEKCWPLLGYKLACDLHDASR